MSLDLANISRNFTAGFGTNGFNFQVGNGSKTSTNNSLSNNALFQGDRTGLSNQGKQYFGPGFSHGFGQVNDQQQSAQLQQVLDFAFKLVKTVLDFMKGGASTDTSTAAQGTTGATTGATDSAATSAASAAAQPAAAAATPASTGAEKPAASNNDSLSKLKDVAAAIEKQLKELGNALSSLSKGASGLEKSAKSTLSGIFKKGIQLGKKFKNISKKLGF